MHEDALGTLSIWIRIYNIDGSFNSMPPTSTDVIWLAGQNLRNCWHSNNSHFTIDELYRFDFLFQFKSIHMLFIFDWRNFTYFSIIITNIYRCLQEYASIQMANIFISHFHHFNQHVRDRQCASQNIYWKAYLNNISKQQHRKMHSTKQIFREREKNGMRYLMF